MCFDIPQAHALKANSKNHKEATGAHSGLASRRVRVGTGHPKRRRVPRQVSGTRHEQRMRRNSLGVQSIAVLSNRHLRTSQEEQKKKSNTRHEFLTSPRGEENCQTQVMKGSGHDTKSPHDFTAQAWRGCLSCLSWCVTTSEIASGRPFRHRPH